MIFLGMNAEHGMEVVKTLIGAAIELHVAGKTWGVHTAELGVY